MLTDADNLPPSDSLCDGIGEEFGNISAEVPVLHQPTSWDPELPKSREDYVMIDSAVGALAEDTLPWEDRRVANLVSKADPIRAEVAFTSCCYDSEVFYNFLDDNMALSKFSTSVGSTTSLFTEKLD